MRKNPPPAGAMFNLIAGCWISHLLYVAAKLEIADRLKDGPRSVEELAALTEVQASALYRVLRALASVGVFAETQDKRFKLTPLAATLQRGIPGSMHAFALMHEQKYQQDTWRQLLHGLKTGVPPFLKAHGIPLFKYLESHPEELRVFGDSMTSVSSTENSAVAAACKFSAIQTVVDVGGGNGSLLAAVLGANPKLKGIHFDQPSVSKSAGQDGYLTVKGIRERCAFESGNFFAAVPKGGDAYMVKRVLHDWGDEQCAQILANCRTAMSHKGKVLAIDAVILPGNAPDRGKLLDILMFNIGGRERTKEEFAAVFRAAGLKLTRVVQTKSPLSILDGVPA